MFENVVLEQIAGDIIGVMFFKLLNVVLANQETRVNMRDKKQNDYLYKEMELYIKEAGIDDEDSLKKS
jgi:hypothetical protein